jgi:hypothetical protein
MWSYHPNIQLYIIWNTDSVFKVKQKLKKMANKVYVMLLLLWLYSLTVQRTIWKRYDNNYEDSLMMARVCSNMLELW